MTDDCDVDGEEVRAAAEPALRTACGAAILSPTTRTLGSVFLEQLRGAVMGAPLPFGESVMIAWPQTVGLIAGTIVLFVVGYVLFQRQEVRA